MSLYSRFHELIRTEERTSRRPTPRGMTLLEIMVVITIIGVVMAAVGVAVLPLLDQAKVDTTKNSIGTVETGLKLYYTRHGKYPDTSHGLNILVQEKMLDKAPKDAWSNDFVYLNEGGKYKVISYGRDGAPGGDGVDGDISNETAGEKR
jgi:general secretion pathway protein G